jgi:hypothetical protein
MASGPPAGLDRGAWGPYPGAGDLRASLVRCWWIIALVAVVVLGAAGLGAWALFGALSGTPGQPDEQLITAQGLSYRVPRSWTTGPNDPKRTAFGIALEGLATGPRFDCGGQDHARASVGVLRVYRKDDRPARMEDALRQFGPEFAASFYGPDATTHTTAPTTLPLDGLTGATSVVTVAQIGGAGGCAVQGQLNVIAVPSAQRGPRGEPTVRLVVFQHDTAGGPQVPGRLSAQQVMEMLAGIRVNQR